MVKKILYGMLLFIPLAVIAKLGQADPTLIFLFSALAIVPLADLIGEATEELSIHTGPRIGGLLNATLGNAAELIITIFAIREGLLQLVIASITGSIIGNLLLVMGLALFLGGIKNGTQTFDRRHAGLNATLMILAVVALLIPSLFNAAFGAEGSPRQLELSEEVAAVMIALYGLSVYYSFTHGGSDPHAQAAEETHKSRWSIQFAVGLLAAATIGIVFMSEFLVSAVHHVSATIGLTELFIGIIVIPMVGNIAEHLVAVEVAYKNKMELSLAISIGSSLQIALFVAPVLVFLNLIFTTTGQPLLLVFTGYELIVLVAAVMITAFVALDGESNWLEGVMLLAVYLIIAIAFFNIPEVASTTLH